MSAEDLERYETEIELQLYQEYRAVLAMFKYVVETERRFYLANEVKMEAKGEGESHLLRDQPRGRVGLGHVPAGPLRLLGPGGDVQGRQRRGAPGEGALAISVAARAGNPRVLSVTASRPRRRGRAAGGRVVHVPWLPGSGPQLALPGRRAGPGPAARLHRRVLRGQGPIERPVRRSGRGGHPGQAGQDPPAGGPLAPGAGWVVRPSTGIDPLRRGLVARWPVRGPGGRILTGRAAHERRPSQRPRRSQPTHPDTPDDPGASNGRDTPNDPGASNDPETAAGELAPASLVVSLGRPERRPGAPVNPPIVLSSTFHQDGTMVYGRDGNPTWEALEQAIGGLEGGSALVFASGMAAIAAVMECLPVPGRVVVAGDAYNGTRRFLTDVAGRGRLRFRTIDVADTAATLAACAELAGGPGRPSGPPAGFGSAGVLWLESPTNPLLAIADIGLLTEGAHQLGMDVVVDNTFCHPAAAAAARSGRRRGCAQRHQAARGTLRRGDGGGGDPTTGRGRCPHPAPFPSRGHCRAAGRPGWCSEASGRSSSPRSGPGERRRACGPARGSPAGRAGEVSGAP